MDAPLAWRTLVSSAVEPYLGRKGFTEVELLALADRPRLLLASGG